MSLRAPKLSSFDLALALEQLSKRPATTIKSPKRAAVALLLRGAGLNTEVLLMRRSSRDEDPWSGQVCLPGGKEEEQDADSRETAHRETQEELGVELTRCSRHVGVLDDVQAMARGRRLETVITPHVFTQTTTPAIVLSEEAVHAFWLPLAMAAQGALDSGYDYEDGANAILLPCWRYQDEVIWGLTYRMLRAFLELARPVV